MKIVTGYRGEAHITSNDDQGRNQGLLGTSNYILNVGNKLEVTASSTSTIQVADGEGITKGVHFRIEPGTSETLAITLPTAGNHRMDYIVAEYEKNTTTGVESVTLKALQGTTVPTSSPLVEPTITVGDILAGATKNDMILAMLEAASSGITGIESGEGVTNGFTYAASITDIETSLASIESAATALEGRVSDIEGELNNMYMEEDAIVLSNFSALGETTKTCKVYRNIAKTATLMLNAQGAVLGATELTIGQLPGDVVPRSNFFKICVTSLGHKYMLAIRQNRNIGILPIDEIDSTVPGNYVGWYRETIAFAYT